MSTKVRLDGVVVVGVDGSTASLKALRWATDYVRESGNKLHIVCTYALPSFTAASMDGGYAALDDSAIRAGAESVLEHALAAVHDAALTATGEVCIGDPAAVLIDASHEAALVVVGTRGHGGFAGRLLGNVSSALPAHANCPTVVVPHDWEPRSDADVPQRKPRIVAGVDGSPSSQVALDHALEYANLRDSDLYVIGGVPLSRGSGLLSWLPSTVDHESVLADMQSKLDSLVGERVGSYPALRIHTQVLDGTGAELLTEFSAASDLIVVGTRGRGGFAGMLLGSTSQSLLLHAKCPVLVVPQRCAN